MNTFQSSLFYKLLFLATQHIFSKPMIFLISFMGFLFSDHSRILQILSSLYTNSKVCIIHIERFKVPIYVKKNYFSSSEYPQISHKVISKPFAWCPRPSGTEPQLYPFSDFHGTSITTLYLHADWVISLFPISRLASHSLTFGLSYCPQQ